MKKAIGIVVAVAAVLLWKFVIGPSIQVTASNVTGHGWDDAEAELQGKIQGVLQQSLSVFELPNNVTQKMAKCTTAKAIEFLNATDCSYLYNETTTSEEKHLAGQEECLKRAGYESKEEQFTFECMKEHFPNDWKYMKKTLEDSFVSSFSQEGVEKPEAITMSACITGKSIELLNARKCALVNKAAAKPEELISSMDGCIKDPDNDKDFQAIIEECTGQEEPPKPANP